jgi:DNA-binding MarR family transcriptional regulator
VTGDDPLAEAVERLYGALVRRARREVPEPTPLTSTQRLALSVVVDGGPLRPGVLADRIGTSDSASTRAVDALAAAGLAERVPDPQDGRAVLVAATEAGRTLVAEGRERLRRLLGSSAVPLDAAEREQLVDLLQRLNAALEDDPA